MLEMLESDIEVLVDSGFVYLPLVFDPSIEEQTRRLMSNQKQRLDLPAGGKEEVVNAGGRFFIRSIEIESFLEHYRKLDPNTFDYLRRTVLSKFLGALNPNSVPIDEKLKTIVFEVLPHFVRKKNKLHKRSAAAGEEIIDLIRWKTNIPPRFYEEAARFSDTSSFRKKLRAMEPMSVSQAPAVSGLVPARSVRQWFLKVLESRIIEEERNRIGNLLLNRERFARLQKKYMAVLLYLSEQGALEITGCGFFRSEKTREYFVYVRTGEYALKDHHGRLYLFSDCRVGVSTTGPVVPYVIDQYKHPLLKGFGKGQKICVRGDFVPAPRFSAIGAIRSLEEGLGALFHGYNSRRGNGYHRLEAMKIEENSIVFEENRIDPDDIRVLSGRIEVKNDFY